jgi:iron(III) transport system substrate-binding protein
MSSKPDLIIFSTRHREFTQALADGFERETGINAEITDIKSDASRRMLEEGPDCLADVVVTLDYRRLMNLAELDLIKPVQSNILNQLVPEHLRDPQGRWFAQSMRARIIFAEKSLGRTQYTYDDLGDDEWRDRLIIRPADHMFNTALIAEYLAQNGEQRTETWLRRIAANRPLRQGGDRNVARAISEGAAVMGLANSYYYGEMRSGIGGAEQKAWIDSVKAFIPTFDNGKTPVNITGAAVAKYSRNPEQAIAFLEYLAGDKGQQIYADLSYEYPASPHVAPNRIILEAGDLTADTTSFATVSRYNEKAEYYASTIPWN